MLRPFSKKKKNDKASIAKQTQNHIFLQIKLFSV